MQCVVPENIHTPPPPRRRAMEVQRGGGVQKEAISEGVGVASRVFCLGALSKIDEQAISYSGGSSEGGPPPYLWTKLIPKGPNYFWRPPPPPPYLRVWMSAPPLISSSGSGTALLYFWMVVQSKKYCFHRRSVICGWLSAFFMACMIVYGRLLLATNE